MDYSILGVIGIILVAYLFDFINGFHDAANSIATIVATKVLTPKQAVLWAAFFNFIAFLFFNLMVAKTIGDGLIDSELIKPRLILSALLGAIAWNLLTWFRGIPSSSSHALIGGLAGSALVDGGWHALQYAGFIKVGIGLGISPLLGLGMSLLVMYCLNKAFKRQLRRPNHRWFVLAQLGSSALLSITHGGNDAQKTMGIIAVLLFSVSWLHGNFYVPFWIVISCQAMISLGTLLGGWRIVSTMGDKITKLNPCRGSAAELSAASVIFVSTLWGVPVSTSQTVTGAIAGVGLAKGGMGIQWPVLRSIFMSWVFTLPAAGIFAAGIEWGLSWIVF